MSVSLILEHLYIVFFSSLLSVAVGLPLGLLAYLFPKVRGLILKLVDLLQTIPALALLGIIMVFVGAGKVTVITGITLYSLLPIVRNTCLGLEEVDPGVKEAARGMGMSKIYRTLFIELPLAFPTVFTGIRIAVVNAIGTAVFAAFVGGGGLGSIITRGIRIQDMSLVLAGTGALMAIAIIADLLMGTLENSMRKNKGSAKRRWLPTLAVLLVCLAVLMPYGISSAGSDELLIYDGNYSEMQIMYRMAKYLIEDQTDVTVTIQDEMSQVNSFKSLIGDDHSCDLMFSYDGTLLTTFLGLDPTDVPEGETLYDYANQVAGEEYGLRLLAKVGFDNTYAIAVTREVADEYSLETISDLVPVAGELIFGAEHEFFTQEGSMKYGPFTEYYGLTFKDAVSVDVSLKYAAIENGSFEVTEVYATDGLNRQADLVILEDDLSFFPEYNGAFLIREDTLTRFSDAPLEDILNELAGLISNDDMMDMTYQTDVLGRSADDVAREFLVERGLLAE
ncbi:MAG: ABC transporter permease subunit [Oscillospiraceae bacterium]|nr:ABC transporter permease subunit [Oscillospiraceae bacterium]